MRQREGGDVTHVRAKAEKVDGSFKPEHSWHVVEVMTSLHSRVGGDDGARDVTTVAVVVVVVVVSRHQSAGTERC